MAVKEQIEICSLHLGWKKAHNAWSDGNVIYHPSNLFKHLLDLVTPLAGELDIPKDPPLEMLTFV